MTSPDNVTATAPDDRYREVYNIAQFVTGLILYPIFCCFGLTGNCLTLIVLRSRKLGGVMSTFLAALAISDGVKLINDLFYFVVILLLRVRPTYGDLAFNIIYPYAHLVAMVTTYTCTTVIYLLPVHVATFTILQLDLHAISLHVDENLSLYPLFTCVYLLPVRTLQVGSDRLRTSHGW